MKKYLSLSFKLIILLSLIAISYSSFSQEKQHLKSDNYGFLKFRSIGPAYASGRIADIEVNPHNFSQYYVAVAAGNVWKTDNSGITFTPVFDNYGSYSIADVAIDPNNTNVIWVGTGEYNSQRAIGYGDGVYLSVDGAKSFKNMGLTKSEHIGRIVIDPRNSHVYVAAQGPLWGPGGDRGLYKSEDMGKSWNKILEISENTGVTDIVFDSRNPDVLYAASYQRRRRVWTLINGGPESAIYKSEDAGKTWRKLTGGLPSGDLGRIGLAISPVKPDYVYAIIEASDQGGVYRTTDRGESWTKMSAYVSQSPQYYNRLFADPVDENKVFSVDTYSKFSIDGGKTWTNLGLTERHVDDHALWINPKNTNQLIIGGDGGIYETFDFGQNWRHVPNLPVTQYYRVAVDNAKPFYHVAGGTQDNNSMEGPSQTISTYGILNSDWETTVGGDGFFAGFDPQDPNIVYSESQYGGLVRYDKRSKEVMDIQPISPAGEAYRWNWNAPFLVSAHSSTRLYFAANKVFTSDDRGNSWTVISPDLTQNIDRNKLKVMGEVQSPEAVAKNASTSLYGNIVAFDESDIDPNLLYAGTDDGLIQITEDRGKSWRKQSSFPNIGELTYVSCILASQHDKNVVYAAFDARKNNDLKPYLLISVDKGKSWKSINANLPEKGTVYSIAEDFKNPDLLFAGTEFGIFFSADKGKNWTQLKEGLPTTAVRDIKLQKDEDDIVIATFGRGFYILDDYSILRNVNEELFNRNEVLFPVKNALLYMQTSQKYGQGATYYKGQNPEYGTAFTYYLKENIKSKKDIRKDEEKAAKEAGKDILYPDADRLRTEDDEILSKIMFEIYDDNNKIIRRIDAPATKGFHRVYWGLRFFNLHPVTAAKSTYHEAQDNGVPVMPGKYSVKIFKVINGVPQEAAETQYFELLPLNNATFTTNDRKALADFQLKVAQVYSASEGLKLFLTNLETETEALRTAVYNSAYNMNDDYVKLNGYLTEIKAINRKLTGDETISKRNENQAPSVRERVNQVVYGIWSVTCEPTESMITNSEIGRSELKILLEQTKILNEKIEIINKKVSGFTAPWSPGKIPELK